MIGLLRGMKREICGRLIIDVGGIGYEVTVSDWTSKALPIAGSEIELIVFRQTSERGDSLYGQLTVDEREVFDALRTVEHVGPGKATTFLSCGLSPHELVVLIAQGDPKALTKLNGIGKDTARKLVETLGEWACSWLAEREPQPALSGR